MPGDDDGGGQRRRARRSGVSTGRPATRAHVLVRHDREQHATQRRARRCRDDPRRSRRRRRRSPVGHRERVAEQVRSVSRSSAPALAREHHAQRRSPRRRTARGRGPRRSSSSRGGSSTPDRADDGERERRPDRPDAEQQSERRRRRTRRGRRRRPRATTASARGTPRSAVRRRRPRRQASSARCMTPGRTDRATAATRSPKPLQPQRQVVGVDAEGDAPRRPARPASRRRAPRCFSTMTRSIIVGHGGELVRDEQHAGAVLADRGARASRGTVAGMPRPRRRSAHRARAASGSLAKARAMNARCCWPPESSFSGRSATSARSTDSIACWIVTRSSGLSRRHHPRCRRRPEATISRPWRAPRSRATGAVGRSRAASARGTGRAPRRRAGPSPNAGATRPRARLSRVDLPDPFGPTSATNSPGRTARETFSITGSRP